MLRYFRINDPYRLLSLLVLLLLASLPLLIDMPGVTLQELKGIVLGEEVGSKRLYVEIIDHTPPMMAATDGVLDFFFGRSLLARHILALIIIFFQAAYFGILLINNKAYNESNYLPALIFGFLCFFSFDLLAVSPELLASTLLLLALNKIFVEIEFRTDKDSVVVSIGFYLGLASLFIFSYTVFLIGTVFVLVVYARATLRKTLLLLFGYLLVHATVITLYYCFENTSYVWEHFYVANFFKSTTNLIGFKSILVLAAVPLVYFVFSLFMLTREARFTKYQSQLFQVIFIWLAIALIQIKLTDERTPHSFFTFIPPMAYFISHYLLLIRRKWIAEGMLWLFLAGLLSVNILSHNSRIRSVDYSLLFPTAPPYQDKVSNKKVMIIGNQMSLYQKNTLGGFFLDWEISRKYFEHPDYYENIIKIDKAFDKDPPDVIVDDLGLMGPIMDRIPRLKELYRKEENLFWKR